MIMSSDLLCLVFFLNVSYRFDNFFESFLSDLLQFILKDFEVPEGFAILFLHLRKDKKLIRNPISDILLDFAHLTCNILLLCPVEGFHLFQLLDFCPQSIFSDVPSIDDLSSPFLGVYGLWQLELMHQNLKILCISVMVDLFPLSIVVEQLLIEPHLHHQQLNSEVDVIDALRLDRKVLEGEQLLEQVFLCGWL